LQEADIKRPAEISPYVPPQGLPVSASDFDVEPVTNDLYAGNNGGEILSFTEGDPSEPSHEDAPRFFVPFATGNLTALTLDDNGHVFVAAEGGQTIYKFKRGSQVASVHTDPADPDAVGHTTAVGGGSVEPAAGNTVTACRVTYSTSRLNLEMSAPGTLDATSKTQPCTPAPPFTSPTDVTASLSGLAIGTTYYFRVEAQDAKGWIVGATRGFDTVAALKLRTLPATEVDTSGATLNGSFDPDGEAAEYWFEYGLAAPDYGLKTAVGNQPASTGVTPVALPVDELPSGQTFHFRIVAQNAKGTTYGQDLTFRTAAAPEISGLQATKLLGTSAMLNARIDPVGSNTSYHFDYGTSDSYGHTVPAEDESIGTEAQTVSQPISGLDPGSTYHFRVTATNAEGTTVSPDATFDYQPPNCPNALVRQETHASFLPDCRGYELVSPGDAGSVVMFAGDSVIGSLMKIEARFAGLWPTNTGLATNPARFSYIAGFGQVKGTDSPNVQTEFYTSTRTPSGWVTTLPGLKSNESLLTAATRCSDDLGVCTDHALTESFFSAGPNRLAADMFDVSGTRLGTLPSNISDFPEYEYGDYEETRFDEQLSGDGSTYVFSSPHVFATGGTENAPGSTYVDDIASGSVETISYLPGGEEPIPQDGSNGREFIQIPAVSKDGSHILMSVEGSDGPNHLYMRVGGGTGETYDVSQGHGVTYLGMNGDGTIVDFAATQKLSPADTDNSSDIYQWRENEGNPTLTVVSQGNGNGDSDECTPVGFGSLCGALPIEPEKGHPFGWLSVPSLDDYLAEDSGDVFFYSPENLDPARPGVKNQRNLYEYHDGAPHLVATLEPGTQVSRIQISPDGVHAGLLTASNLTGYDSRGRREMYTYDAETGEVRCASCRPDGLPPKSSTTASQSGPFMSDDGRVFFSTREELSLRDVDGRIADVYEFVDGRPQLISSGTASRDVTSATSLLNPGNFPKKVTVGLESVSADGTDVFFASYDSLVPQDKNGPDLKFYDARTTGGFRVAPAFAGCEAADECHEAGSQAPAPPVLGTGANLGSSGNAKKAKKKHRRKHHRQNGKRYAHSHRHGNGRHH
jgi:hypothetical protein